MSITSLNSDYSELEWKHIFHLYSQHPVIGNLIHSSRSYVKNYFNPNCPKCQYYKIQFKSLEQEILELYQQKRDLKNRKLEHDDQSH